MPRWLWFTPLAVLLLATAVLGYRHGWRVANLTESDAIEAWAARYMEETGAEQADCTAVPGQNVWLVIRCGTGQDRRVYRLDRFGRLLRPADPDGGTDVILEPNI